MRDQIAIIGMACRFPGARSVAEFWQNLLNGVESITFFSDAELLRAGVDAATLADKDYVKASPIIDDIYGFDADFFGFAPKEADVMDPQQRVMLQIAWEAFEDAGYPPTSGHPTTGVFTGSGGVVTSYLAAHLQDYPEFIGATGAMSHIGNDKDFLSTRISFKLNLTGPSVNVQTACSTSMVAVHLACRSLQESECDMALAGASAIRFPHIRGYVSRKGDILSPDGHCRAFDADAQGTIFGSGVGAVVLKRLSDALRDRDNIYAVIGSTAINNDGAEKVSYTASSVTSQAVAIVEALTLAGVDPGAIGYVECHGTGTAVGDPLEIMALTQAFRTAKWKGPRRSKIGSVKTNIGHLEQAAGMASLIKTSLILKHGKIPPTLNFARPNPAIDFENGPFEMALNLTDFEGSGRRHALINCLGIGGTNACCVLDQPPSLSDERTGDENGARYVLCLSARSTAAVEKQRRRLLGALDGQSTSTLADLCTTANAGRVHFRFRHAVTGSSLEEIRSQLEGLGPASNSGGKKPFTVFLFPGQGSLYFRAGKQLYDSYKPFRNIFDECSERLSEGLGTQIRDVLFEEERADQLFNTLYAQPLLFALEYALAKLWESWNIVPDAVIGHSVGEIAAVCYAGGLTLEDGVQLICNRAQLMAGIERRGSMAAVFLSSDKTAEFLAGCQGDVSIAAINAPESTVIAGDIEAMGAILSRLAAAGVRHKELKVSQAFHSPLLDGVLDKLESVGGELEHYTPRIQVISNLTGTPIEAFSGRYWRDHARLPVRFMDGIMAVASAGSSVFLEVGPGSTLSSLGRQCLGDPQFKWISTMEWGKPEWESLTDGLRHLYLLSHSVDWAAFYTPWSPRKVSLPTYPFETKRFELKPPNVQLVRREQSANGQPPLRGVRISTGLKEAIYEARYSLSRIPFLDDHRIYGIPILPTTAALDVALSAGRERALGEVTLADVTYWDPLILPEAEDLQVQTILSPIDGDGWTFELLANPTGLDADWRRHVSGRISLSPVNSVGDPARSLAALQKRCPRQVPVERFYSYVSAIGLNYGNAFQCIRSIHHGQHECLTRIELGSDLDSGPHTIHPALLDAAFHIYPALAEEFDLEFSGQDVGDTFLPTGAASCRVLQGGLRTAWVHASRVAGGERTADIMVIDIALLDDNGIPVAEISGLSLRRMSREMLHPSATKPERDWIYELAWRKIGIEGETAHEQTAGAARWVVFCDRQGVGDELCQKLAAIGAEFHIFCQPGIPALPPAATILDDQLDGWSDQVKSFFRDHNGGKWEVVYLWAIDANNPTEVTGSLPDQRLYRHSLEILRGIVKTRSEAIATPRLWIVTQAAQAGGIGQPPVNVQQPPLWGMGRTFAWEAPVCWGGLIDLDPEGTPETNAHRLLQEILISEPSDQRVLRGEQRMAARLVRSMNDADEGSGPLFRKDGVYLITGGLGSLGARVAKWMARQGAGHVVLTSRQGRQGRETLIAEIERTGVLVTAVKADVADASAMRNVFACIDGLDKPLRGIFHCAGILDDGVIEQMRWERFKDVTDPKIVGGWLLHQLSLGYQLDHFILFSSILSVMGSAGQLNYTAGNAFLDGLAEYRWQRNLVCQVMNWGPWDEGGLATKSGQVGRSIWKARGIGYIPPEEGIKVLEYLVRLRKPSSAIILADWSRFLKQFNSPPDFYLELAPKSQTKRPACHVDLVRLNDAPPWEKRAILMRTIAAEVANVLGIEDGLDEDRSTADLGMDSLMSVNLMNRLDRILDRPTPLAKLIQGPSVAQLVDLLYPELPDVENQSTRDGDVSIEAEDNRNGSWLVSLHRGKAPFLRLICFPFAGGGSAAFRRWDGLVHPKIELVAVEPPGRLRRIEETPVSNIAELVDALEKAILADRHTPFAFFGHCLGGLVLYETGKRIIDRTGMQPVHVFVSGSRPPHLVQSVGPFEEKLMATAMNHDHFDILKPLHQQDDEIFSLALRHFDIPETRELVENKSLRSILLPAIRAEFEMSSRYHPPAYVERWNVPFTCFAGEFDAYVTRDQMLEWSRYTLSDFKLFVRQGSHFLMAEDSVFVVNQMNAELVSQFEQ